jgi:putative DNA primase/helicase
MPGTVPKGAAVRLAEVADILGIAEGIETALAASVLYRVPVWSGLNAAGLEAWCPPETVRDIIVFGDHDERFSGQKAAYALAYRLSSKWRVEVRIPTQPGTDWNDVLHKTVAAAARTRAGLPDPRSRS